MTDADGPVATTGRHNHGQITIGQLIVHIVLLLRRRPPDRVREHPHLHEVHGFGARGVHLRMTNARARAHSLYEPWIEHAVIPFGIAMLELPAQHPRDDLPIAVGMGAESTASGDLGLSRAAEMPHPRMTRSFHPQHPNRSREDNRPSRSW